ncbi:MAG: cache domain-containing protein, partial [Spirochaetaceae bacterium]|nr:cache domain-containing protein [Spirochaetaceae bacterium]
MILDRGRILRCLPLALFGFLANLAPLELFLGAKLYFGGLFGLAAMALCGPRLGALALAFAGLGAGLRGDPGFALLALAEAFALGAALASPRWRFYGLVVLDSAFWLALGLWAAFALRILGGRPGSQAVLDAAVLGTGGMTLAAVVGALRLLASHYAGRPEPEGLPTASPGRLKRRLSDILGDDRRAFRLVLVELGLFIAFVPLFGILLLSSAYNEHRIRDEIRAKLEVTARSFEMVSVIWRAEKEAELARLEDSAAPALASGRGTALEYQLAGRLRSRPELAALGILDAEGAIRFGKADPARRPGDRIGAPLPEAEVVARARAGRSGAFELVADAAGRPHLLIVRPFAAGSATAAFAYSVIATDTLADLLKGVVEPGGAAGSLVDPRGRVAATSEGGLPTIRSLVPRAG